jgi:protein-disulfide isomerase
MRVILGIALTFLIAPLGACQSSAGTAQPTSAKTAAEEREMLVKADAARAIGPEDAKVVLVELFDFGCSACQEFHRTRSDSLKAVLPPDVRFIAMGFLIPRFPRGYHAAEAALCAGALGGPAGYQTMADRLMAAPSDWENAHDPRATFIGYAREAKLDVAAFTDCTDRDMMAPVILSDLSIANNFEAQATPTFVAIPNGAESADDIGRLEGVAPISRLIELIDAARAKAK